MDEKELLDIYTDYLINSFGLSRLLNGAISHDPIQRFLSQEAKTGKDLWLTVKPYVRQVQAANGIIIVDDSIAEKQHIDEKEIICWHYDHSKERNTKGINFITALYYAGDVSLPVNYHLVQEIEFYIDKKTQKQKRHSPVTKNEVYQDLLRQVKQNEIPFRYVLNDVWFASADNMTFVKHELDRDFVMLLKTVRKVALSFKDKRRGRHERVDALVIEPDTVLTIYLESVDFPFHLIKQVFTNGDGSIGILYLVPSDLDLSYDSTITIYGKRWNVESYHSSFKQKVSLSKSPTKTVTTQNNHFFATLCAYIKLEMVKVGTKTNHLVLKSSLYIHALRSALQTLDTLQPIRLAA